MYIPKGRRVLRLSGTRLIVFSYILFMACWRSAMISSICSVPMERRTVAAVMPHSFSSSSFIWE